MKLLQNGLIAFALGAVAVFATATPAGTITVDDSVVYQTMRGWELNIPIDQKPDEVFDEAVANGLNRAQLSIKAGMEHATDNYAIWKAAGSPQPGPIYDVWRAARYETINDNNDPNVINPAGFHFTELDDLVDRNILPWKARLEARGEKLYINLCYVAFTKQVTSGADYVHDNAAEYAEFLLAVFQHLQSRYGWVPDGVDLILEPDNVVEWQAGANGSYLGQALKAAGDRLAAAGFRPDFSAPSTTSMSNAISYFDNMIAVPGALAYVTEYSYHRYAGVSLANLQAIAGRAQKHGLSTAMLEWWTPSNTYRTLHEDLKVGLNSAWQKSVLGGRPEVAEIRYTGHYFRHVRLGARRVGATSSDGTFDPLAFLNANGAHTVVVKATTGGSFSIRGLPAGTYRIRYTTAAATDVDPGDQTIGDGGELVTSIPAAGVLVVFMDTLPGLCSQVLS